MIPVEELRAWTGATAEEDELLEQLEARAVAEVEVTTGAYLTTSGSVVDRIIGNGFTELRLPKWPVTAVASVESSSFSDPDADPEPITDFVLRSPVLVRTRGRVWELGLEYEVTYTAGYAADAFPPIYRQAVLDIVKATYDAQIASLATDEGLQKESLGEYSYELASGSTSLTAAAARDDVDTILRRLPKRIRV